MRPRLPLVLSLIASVSYAASPTFFGPALYTLRATDKVGSSLMLLDQSGKETLIDRDGRTAGGGGLMSSVLYHASFYGAFSATPDLRTVVFTKHGKVKAPFSFGIGGFGGGSGGGVGYEAAFGEHDLDGIYAWDQGTGNVTRVWEQDSLIAQLKAWLQTTEGAIFAKVDLKNEVRANRPSALYHLKDNRFAWINGASVFELDPVAKTARILASDLDKGQAVGGDTSVRAKAAEVSTPAFQGKAFTFAFSQRAALSSSWQREDGSVIVARPGLLWQIPTTGPVAVTSLPQGHRIVWQGPGALAVGNSDQVRQVKLQAPSTEVPSGGEKVEGSLFQPSSDGDSTFVYKHYKGSPDRLTRTGPDGKPLWSTPLGDCRFGFLLAEDGDKVHVVVRRTAGDLGMRLTLNARTGEVADTRPWLPGEAIQKELGGYPASAELPDHAILIPAPEGFLVWAPSRGEVEGSPASSWEVDATALGQTSGEKARDGQWCLLTRQLTLKPLGGRALADQMAVLVHGRMQPVMNWINSGICQSSNPGDRVFFSVNKKPLPFFTRDFGFWASPALTAFAKVSLATASAEAKVPVAEPGK